MEVKVNMSEVLDYAYKTVLVHLQNKDILIPEQEGFAMDVALDISHHLAEITMARKHIHSEQASTETQTDIDGVTQLVFEHCEEEQEIAEVLNLIDTVSPTTSTSNNTDMTSDIDEDDITVLSPPIWQESSNP